MPKRINIGQFYEILRFAPKLNFTLSKRSSCKVLILRSRTYGVTLWPSHGSLISTALRNNAFVKLIPHFNF